jgi:hypothetical protein
LTVKDSIKNYVPMDNLFICLGHRGFKRSANKISNKT